MLTSIGCTVENRSSAEQALVEIVISLIRQTHVTGGDRDLATRLQTKTRMMGWLNNLFIVNDGMKDLNLRKAGELAFNTFRQYSRTGEIGWAQFDRAPMRMHTIMDRVITKLTEDGVFGGADDSYIPVNALSSCQAHQANSRREGDDPDYHHTYIVELQLVLQHD